MARLFAKVTGVVLLLLGIVGFMSGDFILGLNSSLFEDSLHVILGLIGVYAGFIAKSEEPALMNARWLGPIYIVVVVVGFIIPSLFGLINPPLGMLDHVVHLALGVVAIFVGYRASNNPTPAM